MALGIYVDFSKALELINNSILLRKLENYGVRGTALAVLKSSLSEWTQFVDANNDISARKPVIVSVPQRSILGPLLFLIYNMDIVRCTNNATFVFYADDTTVFITGNLETEIEEMANKTLPAIACWASVNLLKLYPCKIYFLYTPERKTLINGSNLLRALSS